MVAVLGDGFFVFAALAAREHYFGRGFPNQFFDDSWATIANVDGPCVRQVDAAHVPVCHHPDPSTDKLERAGTWTGGCARVHRSRLQSTTISRDLVWIVRHR